MIDSSSSSLGSDCDISFIEEKDKADILDLIVFFSSILNTEKKNNKLAIIVRTPTNLNQLKFSSKESDTQGIKKKNPNYNSSNIFN